jgi:superfamily II DNA or RNA helicase
VATYFQQHHGAASPVWLPPSTEVFGLRKAQIGAAWALAAHFTRSDQPGQVVLPTGVGKTAVMTLSAMLTPCTRVLAIAPSHVVRDQIADEFERMGVLRSAASIPENLSKPKVALAAHRLAKRSDWTKLRSFDVVVGTPGCLSPALEGVSPPPKGLFDLVIVDEGHHAPATTWQALLEAFSGARIGLFTATPFRRDRKALPGLLAYDYPLASALSDGVYAPVSYVPVSIPPGADRDALIAEAVADRLRDPVHAASASAFIARTDRLEHARALVDVYETAGLNASMVSGQDSRKKVQGVLRSLGEGSLAGIITVGVLGEGLDQPRLKIAAYHKAHKSLAPTLQFVGRISRISKEAEAPAELIAVPDEVRDETSRLYEEDASWAELVPDLMDAAVAAERDRTRYVAELARPHGEEFSMYALQPRKETQIYVFPSSVTPDLSAEIERLGNGQVVHSATDDDGDLRVLVSAHRRHPDWLRSDALDSIEYNLHLIVVDRTRQVLFISTSSDAASLSILDAIGASSAAPVSGRLMNRVLHAKGVESYFSVGMRSTTPPGGRRAAYTTLSGNAVGGAVSTTAARTHGLGHVIGRTRDDKGLFSALGVSVNRAKVWVPDTANLYEYKLWCHSLAGALRGGRDEGLMAPGLPLALPTPIETFPDNPVTVLHDRRLVEDGISILLSGGRTFPAWEAEIEIVRTDDRTCYLVFSADDAILWEGTVSTTGAISPLVEAMAISPGVGEPQTFSSVLQSHPPTIYFADGSLVRGSMMSAPPSDFPPLPASSFQRWDWTGVDIRAEAREPRKGMENIINRTARWIAEEWPDSVIVLEDGKGEIADLVAIRDESPAKSVALFHCKWSSEDTPGHRLDDLYQVIGQVMRSTAWTSLADVFWTKLLDRLANRPKTSIHPGSPSGRDVLARFAETTSSTRFSVFVVQPGLLIDSIETWNAGTILLGACDDWCRSEDVSFGVVGA